MFIIIIFLGVCVLGPRAPKAPWAGLGKGGQGGQGEPVQGLEEPLRGLEMALKSYVVRSYKPLRLKLCILPV